jgi:hypothetical protein
VILSPHTPALLAAHRFQGDTNDCGPYAATTALNALLGLHLEPAQVAEALNRPRWRGARLTVRRVPGAATFPWGLVDLFSAFGVAARWRFGAAAEPLPGRIAAGDLLMPIIGGWRPWPPWAHFLILAAYDPAVAGWGFIDPMVPSAELHWRTDANFRARWRNFGQVLVEVPALRRLPGSEA